MLVSFGYKDDLSDKFRQCWSFFANAYIDDLVNFNDFVYTLTPYHTANKQIILRKRELKDKSA